jgi:hypothetical protein
MAWDSKLSECVNGALQRVLERVVEEVGQLRQLPFCSGREVGLEKMRAMNKLASVLSRHFEERLKPHVHSAGFVSVYRLFQHVISSEKGHVLTQLCKSGAEKELISYLVQKAEELLLKALISAYTPL